VADSASWTLAELVDEPAPAGLPCGIADLDELTGGLRPGSIWGIAASSGDGASKFAIQTAASAARSGGVLLANGHTEPHLLTQRVENAARAFRLSSVADARSRLHLASWVILPDIDPRQHWWAGGNGAWPTSDLVVLDTLDEMFDELAWPPTAEDRLRKMRWVRDRSRHESTAVLMTARVPPTNSEARAGAEQLGGRVVVAAAFEDAWRRHWAYEVFADICDVRLELFPQYGSTQCLAGYIRGVGRYREEVVNTHDQPGRFQPIRTVNSVASPRGITSHGVGYGLE